MPIKIGGAEWRARREELLNNVRRQIDEDGWIITGVFDPDNNNEMFIYTVGLTRQGKPELLITEVPAESLAFCEHLLTNLAERHAGTTFTAGETVEVEVGDTLFTAKLIQVQADDKDHHLGTALAIYGDQVQVLRAEPAEHSKSEEN